MMQGRHATAVVMEMASRYIVTPDRLDQMEVNSFNLLLQASLSAATVRTAQGKLPNLLILLVNKLNDLPACLSGQPRLQDDYAGSARSR